MTWWSTFETQVATNLGMGIEYIIPLVIAVIGLVISGKDTKAASALTFVLSAVAFIIVYNLNLEYLATLLLMIASLIVMALQMFFDYKEYGGGIV